MASPSLRVYMAKFNCLEFMTFFKNYIRTSWQIYEMFFITWNVFKVRSGY